MKKKLVVLLALLSAAMLVTGCGDEEGEVSKKPEIGTLNPIPMNPSEEISSSSAEQSGEETGSAEESAPASQEPEVIPEGMVRSELTGEWIREEIKDQRPIAVMVDNESIALDHYGVNSADVVYEIMNSTANGRITRLMCIVKDYEKIEQFGSIRSVRPTNFMLAAEYNAILVHDGGPFYINDYVKKDYSNNLSGGFARFSNGKKQEYTEYVTYEDYKNPTTGKSYQGLKKRLEATKFSKTYNKYYPGEHFNFDYNGVTLDAEENASVIELPFPHNMSKLYYNEDKKEYEYYEYGKAHIDPLDNNEITSFKNVIIQKCTFCQLDQNGYLIYNCIGEGEGFFCTEGRAIPITWFKGSESGLTVFKDKQTGEEITLNVGKTYITLVPDDNWNEMKIHN